MCIEDGLDKLLDGKYAEASALFESCAPLPQAEKLLQLTSQLEALSVYTAELSRGSLSATAPKQGSPLLADLKQLHAKLKRLARQLFMATTGYATPVIDYMGDLSESLDFLLSQAMLYKTQVEYDRDHDMDTGLLNRKAFMRGVYDILQMQPNKVGVLFCCRLDNIKYINNTHGFTCGDLYIAKVVEVLRLCESEPILRARLSGNEFAVYAHGFNHEEEAAGFVRDSLQVLFNTKVELPQESVKIRASCGVAIYPHDALESDVLMTYASHAMFEVKTLNRGTMMRFNPEVYRMKAGLLSRQERLDELIESKLIEFAFQPIVCLRDVKIVGYEALLRAKSEDFKSPLDLLTLAEDQSKLSQLERVTFEVIFEWVFRNLERLAGKKIFFNTNSVEYLDSGELRKIHPQYKTIVKHMVFEILETEIIESLLLEKVNALRRELSASIAIDDFGCGHSNALRLISISPDILKVDRFFISNIHSAPASKREFLLNILAYCRSKGIQTLAEGVETQEELATVISMDFDYAQGFFLGRPEFEIRNLDPALERQLKEIMTQNRVNLV